MTFGFPLGHVLEKSRNLLARVAKPDESQEERTGASGRRFQPSGRAGLATQALSAPFRVLRRGRSTTRASAPAYSRLRSERTSGALDDAAAAERGRTDLSGGRTSPKPGDSSGGNERGSELAGLQRRAIGLLEDPARTRRERRLPLVPDAG